MACSTTVSGVATGSGALNMAAPYVKTQRSEKSSSSASAAPVSCAGGATQRSSSLSMCSAATSAMPKRQLY